MITTSKKNQLFDLVINQLNYCFNDEKKIKKKEINQCLNKALDRTINCFSKINNSYYCDTIKKKVIFNHLNSDHLATFLYFLSNSCFKNKKHINICDKIYYLNKMLNSIDLYYEVKMPEIFLLIHPVGTVLGRAEYSNFLIVYQGVNVGSNKSFYPKFSKYVTLRPSTTILGKSYLKENSEIAAGSIIIDKTLNKNSVYFGNPKNFIIKTKKKVNSIWI
jgi:serine O-acetyltransferase